jgi:hypothetical protein
MVLAYDVAALATTFNYPLFIGQGGLEFWILNASLFAAWTGTRAKQRVVYVITGTADELRGLAGGRNVALPARVRRALPEKHAASRPQLGQEPPDDAPAAGGAE